MNNNIFQPKQIFFFLIVMIFCSCSQWKYTDYGRPMDFLKAKNNKHQNNVPNKTNKKIEFGNSSKIEINKTNLELSDVNIERSADESDQNNISENIKLPIVVKKRAKKNSIITKIIDNNEKLFNSNILSVDHKNKYRDHNPSMDPDVEDIINIILIVILVLAIIALLSFIDGLLGGLLSLVLLIVIVVLLLRYFGII